MPASLFLDGAPFFWCKELVSWRTLWSLTSERGEMAGFFTLPELRAELQTMGHDDIPDDLICAFLSQLQLTQVPADGPQQPTTARAKVLPVSKNPKPYVYGSDAYRPSHGALPKSSSRSGKNVSISPAPIIPTQSLKPFFSSELFLRTSRAHNCSKWVVGP